MLQVEAGVKLAEERGSDGEAGVRAGPMDPLNAPEEKSEPVGTLQRVREAPVKVESAHTIEIYIDGLGLQGAGQIGGEEHECVL